MSSFETLTKMRAEKQSLVDILRYKSENRVALSPEELTEYGNSNDPWALIQDFRLMRHIGDYVHYDTSQEKLIGLNNIDFYILLLTTQDSNITGINHLVNHYAVIDDPETIVLWRLLKYGIKNPHYLRLLLQLMEIKPIVFMTGDVDDYLSDISNKLFLRQIYSDIIDDCDMIIKKSGRQMYDNINVNIDPIIYLAINFDKLSMSEQVTFSFKIREWLHETVVMYIMTQPHECQGNWFLCQCVLRDSRS